jgi:hypothetical protein
VEPFGPLDLKRSAAQPNVMLKLHRAPNSRAARIVWMLEELQLPYVLYHLDFHPSGARRPDRRAAPAGLHGRPLSRAHACVQRLEERPALQTGIRTRAPQNPKESE